MPEQKEEEKKVTLKEKPHKEKHQKEESKQEEEDSARRFRSSKWTSEEHQIIYDLIACGEYKKNDLLMELLPGKTI